MKQKIEAVLLPLLTAVLGFVLSPFFRGLWDWCADVGLPALTKTQKLSLVAGLAILCLVLGFALYAASSKRLLMRRYQHLEKRGFWIHRKTKKKVCGDCLISGIESPLALCGRKDIDGKYQTRSWFCGRKICGLEYFYEYGDTDDDK